MNKTAAKVLPYLIRAIFLLLAIAAYRPAWADDVSLNLTYTQFNINADSGIPGAFGTVTLQYVYATNTLTLSNNTVLFSENQDARFWSADGIVLNPQNGNFLMAGGGDHSLPGLVFQFTPSGAEANPFSFSFTPALINYSDFDLIIVPLNGSQSGFTPNTLLATEKEYGFNYIVVYPLSPSMGNGTAYPVTGDDLDVDGVAFDGNGIGYYSSGTVTSNQGYFGTITFNGTQFVTKRITAQMSENLSNPGHRLFYDSYTGDILVVGGSELGQYDPRTNTFHVLLFNGLPQNSFQFNNVATDGLGHALITACCGLPGDAQNGEGDLIIVDYSHASKHWVDASSGVQWTYQFLASSLGSVLIGPVSATTPIISQQPSSVITTSAQTATFTVFATGIGLSYQWQSMPPGGSTFTPISGATSSTYTTPATTLPQSGTQYECVVTNSAASVVSNPATLTVNPVGITAPSGLALYWSFDTSADTNGVAQDQSNNNGNGTISGNPAQAPGKLNQALTFNGANTSVTMNAYADEATEFNTSMTLAAWINTTNSTRTEAFISKYSAAGSGWGYTLRTNPSGTAEIMFGWQDVNSASAVATDTTRINDGQWHHVVAVLTIGQGVTFYVDGVYSSATAMNLTNGGDNWANLTVGVNPYTYFGNYFTGSIDEVRVYNRALSAAEVSAVYQLSGGGPAATLSSITVTPASPTVNPGGTQGMTATGNYTGGGTQNLSSQVTWSSGTPGVATVNSVGIVTGVAGGTSTISATLNGVTGSTVVTVAALSSITVTPGSPTVNPGGTQGMTATGNYTGGGTQNLSSQVSWSSGTPGVATVSSAGVVTGVASGTSTISAMLNGVTGSTVVTVPALSSIMVTPGNPSINAGNTQGMTATGNYGGGGTQNITSQVTWSSGTPGVATVNNAGVVTGVSAGTSVITATLGSVSGTTTVGVTNAVVQPPSGLVLYWSFDTAEDAGGVAVDQSNNNGNGTISGNPAQVAGKLNQALSFNGTNTSVSMNAYTDEATEFNNSVTLAAWVQTTNATRTEGIISKYSAAGYGWGYLLRTNASGTAEVLLGWGDVASGPAVATDTTKINDGQWHHVAAVLTMGQGISFYVDGNYSSTTAINITGGGDNWSYLTVGVNPYTPAATYFSGNIDEVRVYNRALSAAEVSAVYQLSGGGPAATLSSITVTPGNPTVNPGGTQSLTATGNYAGGGTQNLSSQVTWSSGTPGVATVNSVGVVTGVASGTSTISAMLNGVTGSTVVTVAALSSITVTPGSPTVNPGGTQGMTATGNYAGGGTQNLSSQVTWSSGTPGVATVSSAGVVTGVASGTSTISATLNGVTGSTVATVSAPTSITVTPANPSVLPGGTQGMTATGNYGGGGTQNLSSQVSWSSGTPGVATVSSAGVITAIGSGTATIQAKLGSVTGSTVVTVPALSSIMVTPGNPSINAGNTQGMTATGNYGGGGTQNITSQVTWSSGTPGVATVNNAGVVTGVSAGTSVITATLGSVSGTTTVGVTNAVVQPPSGLVLYWSFDTAEDAGGVAVDQSNNNGSGTISGNPAQVAGKLNQALSFNGTNTSVSMNAYTDEATEFNNSVTLAAWVQTTNATRTEGIISKYSAAGYGWGYLLRTNASGTAEVLLGWGDVASGPAVATDTTKINDGQWHHVAAVLTMGQGISFYVDGNYSSTTAINITGGGDNWSYLTVGVNPYTPAATYFSGNIDEVRVYNRALSAAEVSAVYQLSGGGPAATLSSITVTPGNPTVNPGGTQSLTATGNYAGGGTQNLSSQVTWSSGTPGVATVNSVGVVTGVASGTSTISAMLNGVTGSTVVTVAALSSITVTPGSPTVNPGGTQGMTATGNYTGGGTQNLSSQVTWSSGTPGVATVSSAGVVTGVASGTSTISATLNGVTGSTVATVSAPTSITVTPANPSVLPGGTQGMTATGNYGGGGTQNITSQVTWSSGTPGVATVNNAGVVTGVSAGTSVITATLGSVSGTTMVTVSSGGPLTVNPITLLNAKLNQFYSVQLIATGGAAPYRWVLVGGSLPPGLMLSSSGLLSGTPTGPASGVALGSSAPFYVYVVDTNYNSVQPSTGFFLTVTN